MPLNKSHGLITAQGIKFNDKHYSCPLAIKEQWFEHVRTTGPMDVKVYFDSMDYTEIALLINTSFVCCKVIEHNNTQFDPEEYYRKLQQLRQHKNQKK
ncbi:hypothetical protein PAECIP111892_03126 [Paenibacillus auburnensis]|uniref:Uncharacterized protein n=1 Tax=Paenibacillus auburnensis TaxID=2905649 RepID=A0ABN8GGQ5_9BACL|nr:hypothetical protein [Paenibacillus auburnensis]CAH1208525.1 hypothetical protein PAECIP111892_03126 [Paenibacillus auburnensis]